MGREEKKHQQHEESSLKESVKTVSGDVPPWLRRSRRKEREGQSTLFEAEQAQHQKENMCSNVQTTSVVGEKVKQNECVSSIDKPQTIVIVETSQGETLHEDQTNDSAQCGDYNITFLPSMP